jgi:DNA-binding GntR family transcriptional regulator
MRPRRERQPLIDRLPAHPTVREVAYRRLRQLILDGTLAPGERIFENGLAEQLGVSRTPLREALRQLETEGLVQLSARRGAMVPALSAADMHEEFLIRATLEGLAIRLAAPRLLARHFQLLGRELDRMQTALAGGKRSAFLEHHRRFHMTLFDTTQAPRLVRLLANLLEASERYEQLELAHDVLHADEMAHHRVLYELLQTGDGERAATTYMASFLAHGEAVIRRLVDADSKTSSSSSAGRARG